MNAPESFVRFVAGNELFALPLREVREVVPPAPLTPIPGAPPSALGVMNHHGRVITLVDLRALLGASRPKTPRAPGICLLLDAPDRRVALGVSRVDGIGPLEVLEGVARQGDRAVSVLSAAALFAAVDLSFGQGAVLESAT